MGSSNKPFNGYLVHTATMLVVADLDQSVAFYCDKLGFEILEDHPTIALLACGTMLLYLIPESPPTADKPSVTLGTTTTAEQTSVNLVFRVTDCRTVYAALAAQGVPFLTAPQQPPWGGWRCFARDPNGYLIEIEEP